jgi:hypothetical protein
MWLALTAITLAAAIGSTFSRWQLSIPIDSWFCSLGGLHNSKEGGSLCRFDRTMTLWSEGRGF